MIVHHPIEWWEERFRVPFTLIRFGDGEFLCIEGKQGNNSHGCIYTQELRVALIECLNAPVLKGMQRILPSQLHKVRHLLKGDWVDTEILGESLAGGQLKGIFDFFRTQKIVIVSSASKNNFPIPHEFVETPLTNAHAAKADIQERVLALATEPKIFLFACGMAAGPIIHGLHGKVKGSLIDIGHILDPFLGDMSREYLKDVPQDILNSNL